jgi:hypothetical protein
VKPALLIAACVLLLLTFASIAFISSRSASNQAVVSRFVSFSEMARTGEPAALFVLSNHVWEFQTNWMITTGGGRSPIVGVKTRGNFRTRSVTAFQQGEWRRVQLATELTPMVFGSDPESPRCFIQIPLPFTNVPLRIVTEVRQRPTGLKQRVNQVWKKVNPKAGTLPLLWGSTSFFTNEVPADPNAKM